VSVPLLYPIAGMYNCLGGPWKAGDQYCERCEVGLIVYRLAVALASIR